MQIETAPDSYRDSLIGLATFNNKLQTTKNFQLPFSA